MFTLKKKMWLSTNFLQAFCTPIFAWSFDYSKKKSHNLPVIFFLVWETETWDYRSLNSHILMDLSIAQDGNKHSNPLPSSLATCCASVAKLMQGSFKLNSAHDLDLKLFPWKQASDMLVPCSSIVPPRTVPKRTREICVFKNVHNFSQGHCWTH